MNHEINNAANQPSSRFPINDCYIYERYKTFLLNSVSFMALVIFQVNFIRAARIESKNEIEKHSIDNNNMLYCDILLRSKH